MGSLSHTHHTWPIKHIIDLGRFLFIYLFFLLPCENMTLSESEKPPGNRAQPELITVSPFSRWSGCQGRTWTAPVREAVWCLTAVWGQQVRLHLHLPEATENVCVKFGEGTQICACSTHQQTFGCNGTVFSFFSPPPPPQHAECKPISKIANKKKSFMCWCGSGIQLVIRRRAMFLLNKKRMLQKNTDALNQAAEASHWPPATPAISLHWCLHWKDFA